ncbi:uncharacterized protein LOC122248861 isoform X2 [Penaeus japonicus]|nr:uncharacterized protein LOC122248861 isoform X2 [Penaeus japonicus]
MSHLGTVSRLASSALSATRSGFKTRIPLPTSSSATEATNGLCLRFRQLGISPEEARLSARAVASLQHQAVSPNDIQEYRLPSLVKPVSITVPSLYNGVIMEKDLPPSLNITEKIEPLVKEEIREAPANKVIEKQAARLIVIRRRMMNKHKLKKLRKRMKFEWLKIIQKREYRKEKLFQATQMAKIRAAEAFDAAAYVANILRTTKEKPIPRFWRGKRLPADIIKQLMEEKELKQQKRK